MLLLSAALYIYYLNCELARWVVKSTQIQDSRLCLLNERNKTTTANKKKNHVVYFAKKSIHKSNSLTIHIIIIGRQTQQIRNALETLLSAHHTHTHISSHRKKGLLTDLDRHNFAFFSVRDFPLSLIASVEKCIFVVVAATRKILFVHFLIDSNEKEWHSWENCIPHFTVVGLWCTEWGRERERWWFHTNSSFCDLRFGIVYRERTKNTYNC